MKNLYKYLPLLLLPLLMLASSCRSTKSVVGEGDKPHKASAAEIYKQKVLSHAKTAKALTAKMSVDLALGDREISLNGSLKMKRGEVIQLSLTFPIIGEVGRMEFSPDNVLIIDRINTRYVRVPYNQIDFLQKSNLDFRSLEAVFWNEVFYPGADVNTKIADYSVATAGTHTLLNLTSAPKLDYAFLTITESGLLDRTTVTSKNISDQSALTCIYGNFEKFDNGRFPTTIKLNFSGDELSCRLNLSLSSLDTADDWNTHTRISDRYKEIDPESLLKHLVP